MDQQVSDLLGARHGGRTQLGVHDGAPGSERSMTAVSPSGKSTYADAQVLKIFGRICKKRAGGKSVPVLGGPFAGLLPVANSDVVFAQKVLSVLHSDGTGGIGVELDEFGDGRWTTMPNVHTVRRNEVLPHDYR